MGAFPDTQLVTYEISATKSKNGARRQMVPARKDKKLPKHKRGCKKKTKKKAGWFRPFDIVRISTPMEKRYSVNVCK